MSEAPEVEINPLDMSDEDFLKMSSPAPAAVEEAPAEVSAEEPVVETAVAEIVADEPAVAAVAESDPAVEAVVEQPAEAVAQSTDYEAFYAQVMAPFKANGKTIELRTPEEALQLMQKGANYTRKMQDIAPHRKMLTMLQNNNLLDEAKLSFLIDLDNKNPEAIKKLLKESGIDPLDIDTTTEPAYFEGNHRVTDEEVNFRSALDELSSTSEGKSTLQEINTRWDQASKDLLWKNPEAMATIHSQREVGVYGRIVDEMDRRIVLGTLAPGTPFIEAYKTIGDAMTESDAFADLREKYEENASSVGTTPAGRQDKGTEPLALATRVVLPKPVVKNADAADAATQTRATPKATKEFINPLAMSDDEFLKQFNGRI